MKFDFTDMLYSDDGLNKPRGLVTDKIRTSYPGIDALKEKGYDVGVHWISKDSSNESGFTLKTGIENGGFVFAVIEHKENCYSLYVYQYDNNILKRYESNNSNDIIEIRGGKFSIDKNQRKSSVWTGTVNEINDKIIEISNNRKGTQNNG